MSVAELLARHGGAAVGRAPAGHEPIIMTPFVRKTPSMVPERPDFMDPGIGDTGQLFVTELLRREGRSEEEPPAPRPSGRTRALTAAAGLVLVCGVVTASTAALSGPHPDRTMPGTGAPEHIVGADVLRPDLINASIQAPVPAVVPPAAQEPTAGAGTPAAEDTAGGPAGRQAPDTEPADEQDAGDPAPQQPAPQQPAPQQPAPQQPAPQQPAPQEPGPEQPAPPADGGGPLDPILEPLDPILDPILGTITTFYAEAPEDPSGAYELLGPEMRGSSYQRFEDSWADVESATIEDIVSDGPDRALVTVRLLGTDGTVLHTRQRMQISEGPTPLIEDAALLAASRS